MLKKDFIESEIQKLSEVLARILKLKNQGDLDEALELAKSELRDSFEIEFETLQSVSVEQFVSQIKAKEYNSQKLDLLGQLLFESVYPFEETPETFDTLHKVLGLFNVLEEEHHVQSMENVSRRAMIDNFLNTRQYE